MKLFERNFKRIKKKLKRKFNNNTSQTSKQNTKSEKYIEELCSVTGWDRQRAVDSLEKGKAVDVSNVQYLRKKCYTMTDDEINQMGFTLSKLKKLRQENNNFYIEAASEKSGICFEEIKIRMDAAKKQGISYLKYIQNDCWKMEETALAQLGAFLKNDKNRINENKQKYIDNVCDATGWTEGRVELEINKAKANCEASYEDYSAFKMYELNEEEQRKYVTHGLFVKMRIKYNNHTIGRALFDDKLKFNKTFGDLMNRVWFGNEDLSYEEFLNNIEELDAIIVKPLAATQGIGIKKFICNKSDEENKKNYDEIMNMGQCIIEQYIVQHDEVMEFCPESVNTLRIMTLYYENQCKFLYAVFRTGRGAVVDNFHAGGIAAAVDVNDGTVYTNAADLDGNIFETNPVSGKKIKGFRIPHWDLILETCSMATGRVEGVNLVGWDFAITPEGAELIEGNPGASYIVAQIPNIEDRIGLREAMVDPYL